MSATYSFRANTAFRYTNFNQDAFDYLNLEEVLATPAHHLVTYYCLKARTINNFSCDLYLLYICLSLHMSQVEFKLLSKFI